MSILPEALRAVPSPSLVVDLGQVDRNIAAASAILAGSPIALRPHFKAHRCRPLLRRQLTMGACSGVTCQTAWEALALSGAGFGDVVVTNQIVDRGALRQLVSAARLTRVTVAVDSPSHVDALESAADAAGVRLGVLIEIDVGMGRCGLSPGSPLLLQLARAVDNSAHLSLRGLQAYEGHAVLEPDRLVRTALARDAAAVAETERARLVEAGYACEIVTGGGTGTIDLAVSNAVLDEVQAGSYVLYDSSYARLDLPFRPALFCVATVVSRRDDESVVVNAGLKQLSTDSGFPVPTDRRLTVLGMSDEHTRLRVRSGARYSVGDRITLLPSHVDPTMNLHDSVFAVDAGEVSAWPIDRRVTIEELPSESDAGSRIGS